MLYQRTKSKEPERPQPVVCRDDHHVLVHKVFRSVDGGAGIASEESASVDKEQDGDGVVAAAAVVGEEGRRGVDVQVQAVFDAV